MNRMANLSVLALVLIGAWGVLDIVLTGVNFFSTVASWAGTAWAPPWTRAITWPVGLLCVVMPLYFSFTKSKVERRAHGRS